MLVLEDIYISFGIDLT